MSFSYLQFFVHLFKSLGDYSNTPILSLLCWTTFQLSSKVPAFSSFSLEFTFLCGLLVQQTPRYNRFFWLFNKNYVWLSGSDWVIPLYLKVAEDFMPFIFTDRFWFVHVPFVRVVPNSLLINFLTQSCLVYVFNSFSFLRSLISDCPVWWGCRIHWLHLCGGVRLHQRVFSI